MIEKKSNDNRFYITSKTDKTRVYDYMGCVYPEGIFDLKNTISKLEEK